MERLKELEEILKNDNEILKNNRLRLVSLAVDLFLENIDKVNDRESMRKEVRIKHNGIKIIIYESIWGNYFLRFQKYFYAYEFLIAENNEKENSLNFIYQDSEKLVKIHNVLWEKNKKKEILNEIENLEKLIDKLK